MKQTYFGLVPPVDDIDPNGDGIHVINPNGGGGPLGGGSPQPTAAPSWAVGIFTGTLANGASVTLTIQANGIVSALVSGRVYDGVINNDRLFLNGDWSTLSQSGTGIVTVNQSNSQTTAYTRVTSSDIGITPTQTVDPVTGQIVTNPNTPSTPISLTNNPLLIAGLVTLGAFLLLKKKR